METKANPSTRPQDQKTRAERKRVPMSVPQRRLETPELPGFHLHWFLDSNVPRAVQGGYDPVTETEMPINQLLVGADTTLTGNSSLGTNIRIVGGIGSDGRPEFLNLMKIREDWYKEDQKVLEERNANVMSAIFRDEQIMGSEKTAPDDRGSRYVKTALLNRPTRKGGK